MRNIHTFYLLLLLLCVPIEANPTEVGISVNLYNSQIEGNFDNENEVFIFRGIPFAEPPIENNRWQSPKPISSPLKIIDARKFKPACMQDNYMINWYKEVVESFGNDPSVFNGFEKASEDCLYLNIWTNSINSDSKKPVMVWVHGGGYAGGWSYEPNYFGHKLATKDVVVVTIAYRLNIFGYFIHPEMKNETGNFGLEDQIMALQWIKDNISFYGGDPENITYFGESVGGVDVTALIASPKGKGLFKRGIIQSAGHNLFYWTSREEGLDLGMQTQETLMADDFASMKLLPANKILEASHDLGHPFEPIIDGELIPTKIAKLMTEGSINNVDLMIGSTKNEFSIYINEVIREDDINKLLEQYYPKNKEKLLSMLDLSDPWLAMERIKTNQEVLCPSIHIARALAKKGNNVYQYLFSRNRENSGKMLAYHGAEIPYIFNTHDEWLPTNTGDLELTESMMEYWVEFAKKGTPNSINNPTWKEFGTEENYLILDLPLENSVKLESEFCDIMIQELIEKSNP